MPAAVPLAVIASSGEGLLPVLALMQSTEGSASSLPPALLLLLVAVPVVTRRPDMKLCVLLLKA